MAADCNRCGHCCLVDAGPKEWHKAELSFEQEDRLLRERAKYPMACEMLVFEKGVAVCLVQKLFGKKPKSCKDYPDADDGQRCVGDKYNVGR